MPALADTVIDKFAREYHATGNASEAYRKARPNAKKWKDNSVHVNASRLLADAKVQLRLHELQAEAREKHNVTIESITEMLVEDRSLAREIKQPSAAVSAAMGIAKLHGLILDKSEHTGKDGTPLMPTLNVHLSKG